MKVAIVTPSYNQADYISETVKSVLSQGSEPTEYLIVDGGSTDGTKAILSCLDSPIRWVSEEDRGQADAVNKGIMMTTGEIIGWLNSDDLYYPNAIHRVVAFFRDNVDVDVVYGMANHIDAAGQIIGPYPTAPWNFEALKDTCYICQPATFLRRRTVERYGLLDTALRYCMDYEYWLRLAMQGARFGYLQETLAASRLHPAAKTVRFRVAVHSEINRMQRRVLGNATDRWLSNYAHAATESRIDRMQHPRWFKVEIATRCLVTSVKCNRRISKPMITNVWKSLTK